MVAALVVLYNPDAELMDRALRSVASQVERVFAIDNTPESFDPPLTSFHELGVTYIPLASNQGIAKAQNVGIREVLRAGYSHVLLLDQDSVLPANFVEKLLAAECDLLSRGIPVAAVGPLAVERKNGKRYGAVRHLWFHTNWISIDESMKAPVRTDYLNASGSLIRTAIFERIGFMMERLFIDGVDTEWCLRALSLGYQSYVVPEALMEHDLGNGIARLFGRDIVLHNNVRNYYIIRNIVYLLRARTMGGKWKTFALVYVPKYIVIHSWLSHQRWSSARLFLRALVDGILGRVGPLSSLEQEL